MTLENNSYQVQGVKLIDVAQQFGTPLYVYDGNKVVEQLKALQKSFAASRVKVKYAAKALTSLSVLKLLKRNGSGVDVVSMNEAHIAMKAGFLPTDIMFTSNSVALEEISQAVDFGITINMDNLSLLDQFGKKYGHSQGCCIRLNPGIMAGGNLKISTGHSQSKFGIPVAQLSQVKEIVARHNMLVTGLHIHTGSEITDVDVFMKMADILFGWAREFPDVRVLDFGGGYKVAYKPDDKVTNVEELGEKINRAFQQFEEETGRALEMWIEPGKYIVSEAGYLLTRVNIVKRNPNITFLGVDSGLNQLIRPMMYDAYHEIINISNPSGPQETYTVVGNVCETDTLGADRPISETKEGDLLAIKNAGAYGYAMASNYNSRFRPAEVLIVEGKPHLIRKRDTLEDLLRGQVDIFSK